MPALFHLFQAFGVELEYMIVDARTLDVRPIAEDLLTAAAKLPGAKPHYEDDAPVPGEVEIGPVSWSNELCAHVLEFKTGRPAVSLDGLADRFQAAVQRCNQLLAPHHAKLLPAGMHPWMNPDREMTLWPHGYREVYEAFNRVFNCKGHGWANLQSMHINLPFANDEEFGRLHAAVRALLPLMPALTASSPIMDGRVTGLLDNRLEVYRTNQKAVPHATGRVIPEPVYTQADYDREIFQPLYTQLAPYDPEGILQEEWANSRGCIARFSRNTIEIRVLDVQECPAADLAIAQLITGVVRAICEGRLGSLELLKKLPIATLEPVLHAVVRDADRAVINAPDLLLALGLSAQTDQVMTAKDVWRSLIIGAFAPGVPPMDVARWFVHFQRTGCLSRRMVTGLGGRSDLESLRTLAGELAVCLAEGNFYTPRAGS